MNPPLDSTAVIRVILADDHAIVRKGLREYLEEDAGLTIVAEASTGLEAVQLAREHRPDVVLLDIQMPHLNGIEATRRIKNECPEVRVLALTAYEEEPYVLALLREGADGYLLKSVGPEELVRAIKVTAAGGVILDPVIASKVMAQSIGRRSFSSGDFAEPLSERERDVLRLAGEGRTNKAIGLELNISDRTVQGHLANIYAKLNVGSRTEAVTKALRLGWITLAKS